MPIDDSNATINVFSAKIKYSNKFIAVLNTACGGFIYLLLLLSQLHICWVEYYFHMKIWNSLTQTDKEQSTKDAFIR